jgi:hypothetical protein
VTLEAGPVPVSVTAALVSSVAEPPEFRRSVARLKQDDLDIGRRIVGPAR